MRFTKVGIYWNSTKENGVAVAEELIRILRAADVRVCVSASLYKALGSVSNVEAVGFKDCEMLIVLGGDGTILRALDYSIPLDLPILGVNLGRLGFLTQLDPENLESGLKEVLEGRFTIRERMCMCVEGFDEDSMFALNDIVINRSTPQVRILSLEYEANGIKVNRIAGDGLIVATATGSTAYSLSAGGPIVSPEMDCFVVTPVCPHMFNARPVILSAKDRITVRLEDDRNGARAVLDGRKLIEMKGSNSMITIRRSTKNAKFICIQNANYFELLRIKLSEWTN